MKILAVLLAVLALVGCEKSDRQPGKSAIQAEAKVASEASTAPGVVLEPLTESSSLPGDVRLPKSTAAEINRILVEKKGLVAAGKAGWGTKHLDNGNPRFSNRLILEDSPYLQQHAHNPVNWFPWGEEAFARAAVERKPVLLSIGYATCHWCHVMERESFEDVEIATYLNDHYIAVKVDREERPDIDALYLAAVRKLSGSAGWPATVWLTADREPFFAGTYFPARDGDRRGAPGFLGLLEKNKQLFDADESAVTARGREVAEALRKQFETVRTEEIQDVSAALRKAFYAYERSFDDTNGGWGQRKFPMPARLRFLLRYHMRTGDERAGDMLRQTLKSMNRGGIQDHVAGGFHRYTVDPAWRIPHFEKMLYDNAQLALLYTEAGLALDDESLLEIAERTLNFAYDDMRSVAGGYYSALDAETDGVEGGTYVWRTAELERLGASETVRATPHPSLPAGTGVLNLTGEAPLDPVTAERLLEVRERRKQPRTDTKVVAAWNGMMLEALARLGFALGDEIVLSRARELARFMMREIWNAEESILARTWTENGGAGEPGTASDYAHLVAGLIELFEATGEAQWLDHARAVDAALHSRHFDEQRGAYRRAGRSVELLAVEIPAIDSAVPGANGVIYGNLRRLHALTQSTAYATRADKLRTALGGHINEEPWDVPTLLMGLEFDTNRPREVVVVTEREDSPLTATLRRTYSPWSVAVVGSPSALRKAERRVPWLERKGLGAGGSERAFVCYETVCDLPTTDAGVLQKQLSATEPL